MLKKLLPLAAIFLFFTSVKSQTIYYPSGIESEETSELYDNAMFALMNSEPKKFYALMEEVVKNEPACFKAKAHCAFQTFAVTKGEKPFGDIAQLALNTTPADKIDSVYFEILKNKITDNGADITDLLTQLSEHLPAVEVYYLLGNNAVQSNDLKAAHKYFFRAFRLKNDFAPILSLMAQTSEVLGHEVLAKDFLQRYVIATPQNPKSHEIMGNYLAGKGDYDEAVLYFKKAYELDN